MPRCLLFGAQTSPAPFDPLFFSIFHFHGSVIFLRVCFVCCIAGRPESEQWISQWWNFNWLLSVPVSFNTSFSSYYYSVEGISCLLGCCSVFLVDQFVVFIIECLVFQWFAKGAPEKLMWACVAELFRVKNHSIIWFVQFKIIIISVYQNSDQVLKTRPDHKELILSAKLWGAVLPPPVESFV